MVIELNKSLNIMICNLCSQIEQIWVILNNLEVVGSVGENLNYLT